MRRQEKCSIFRPLVAFLGCMAAMSSAYAAGYHNLSVCVYFRYQETQSIPDDLEGFARRWANVEKQVKVDKVYLETTRNGQLATDAAVMAMKKFFQDRGVKVSGGMGLTVQESNGFRSYCYTAKADREKVKAMAEFTARHFDEIILDDFFFNNTKTESDIAARGGKSWTQFRLELMDDVSKTLIIGPAEAVNPHVRMIIKFPNWYESFQALGYDLAVEPRLFDAIYTGTETRNADTGQRLQSYQSYLQPRYFSNIKPGGNQGGWIDGGQDVPRYAEQFWDTFFAKVPEIMLFNSQQIMAPLNGSVGTDPNATLAKLMVPTTQPDGAPDAPINVARIAGYSAELLDGFLAKLGEPIGVATYKPCNSVGDEYLPNFLGAIGIPIDLIPQFPSQASTILLTAASAYDKDLVTKTEKFVRSGGRAIATTGLIQSLGQDGFQRIAEIELTGRSAVAKNFSRVAGPRSPATLPATPDLNIRIPQLRHFENDSWPSVPFNTAASGYPMAVTANYGQGTFVVLAIPDDFADLYRLPQETLNQIRQLVGRDIFVSLDAPDHVSLFAYDNRTFIVQNFQSQPVSTRVSVTRAAKLQDLMSGQAISPGKSRVASRNGTVRRAQNAVTEPAFDIDVPGHSFRVFKAE